MEFPTLYHKSKTGKMVQWVTWTDGGTVHSEHGDVGGTMIPSSYEAEGKNIGRANETAPADQAIKEVQAKWKKRLDTKYSLTPEEAENPVYLPMLAGAKFEKVSHKLSYPVDVQPKFDGVRCLVYWRNGELVFLSRQGKLYNMPHIKAQLEPCLAKEIGLDGELYCHGKSFQEVTKLVKKWRPGQSDQVEYHVYDCWGPTSEKIVPWHIRKCYLDNLLKYKLYGCANVKPVETLSGMDAKHVLEIQGAYIQDGYEGAIVRVLDAPYELGHRSSNLIKVKVFQDAEYKIVGYKEGKGKFVGCVIWRCITPEGLEFNCTPKGTLEEKAELYAAAAASIGQWLKVQFFELTDDKIPRFPVGLGIRMPEDM